MTPEPSAQLVEHFTRNEGGRGTDPRVGSLRICSDFARFRSGDRRADHPREARLKAELTLEDELARRISRERAQVARWETGGQDPSFAKFLPLVRGACGLSS